MTIPQPSSHPVAAAPTSVAAVAASEVPLSAAAMHGKGEALVEGEGVASNNYSRPQGQNVG